MFEVAVKKITTVLTIVIGLLLSYLLIYVPVLAVIDNNPLCSTINKPTLAQNKNGLFYCESRVLQKGEDLWEILQKDYNIPPSNIPFYLAIFKELNPGIDNPNSIVSQQGLITPYKCVARVNISNPMETDSLSSSSQARTEEYTFSQGDHIISVLRDVYHLSENLIYNEYIDRFKVLNPTIDDISNIEVGQKVIIPLYQKPSAFKKDLVNIAEEIAESREIPSSKDTPVKKIDSDSTKPDIDPDREPLVQKNFQQEPLEEELSQEDVIKNLFTSIASELGGKFTRSGNYFIPIGGGGRLVLDTNSFPVMELTKTIKTIINFNNELSSNIEEVINLNQNNYQIVNILKDEEPESILDKIFSAAGYFAVEKNGDPLVIGDTVKIEMKGKWLIFKDSLKKEGYLINLIEAENKVTSPFIKRYVQGFGIKIMEILSCREGTISVIPDRPSPAVSGPRDVQKWNFSRNEDITDSMLGLIGQPYRKDVNIPLIQSPDNTFAFQVTANRSFKVDEKNYMVTFQELPKKLVDMIKESGNILLQIKEGDETLQIITSILNMLEIDYVIPPKFNASLVKEGANITIIVPGVIFRNKDDLPVLLTNLEISDAINNFLEDKGVKVVNY